MQYKVKEGLTWLDLVDTKWNQSEWTVEQKTLWQEAIFKLGFGWPKKTPSYLEMECFFLEKDSTISYCNKYDGFFIECDEDEKHFSDVFDTIEDEETSTDDVLIINEPDTMKRNCKVADIVKDVSEAGIDAIDEHFAKVGLSFGGTELKAHIHENTLQDATAFTKGKKSILEEVGLFDGVDKPTKSVDTSWTDTHYDQNYILTKEDIKKGYVRLDAYTVAKVWRIGSKDDSGALWHTFKVFPRYGEKNDKEREIRAMYAQIKALAKIEGVDLN